MRTPIVRQQASFMLRSDILDNLKANANRENSSLNNYVEGLLLDILYHTPNDTTRKAILEAKNRKSYPSNELYSSADELFTALDSDE